MKILTLGLALLMLAGLPSCVFRQTEVVRVVEWDPASWKGKTRDQLIHVWGEPAKVQQVDGSEELRYFSYQTIMMRVEAPEAAPGGTVQDPRTGEFHYVGTAASSITTSEVTDVEHTPVAKFWLDDEGVIERYWISTEVEQGCRTHAHTRCFFAWP